MDGEDDIAKARLKTLGFLVSNMKGMVCPFCGDGKLSFKQVDKKTGKAYTSTKVDAKNQ